MEVEDEKHVRGNYFISEIKTNCILLLPGRLGGMPPGV